VKAGLTAVVLVVVALPACRNPGPAPPPHAYLDDHQVTELMSRLDRSLGFALRHVIDERTVSADVERQLGELFAEPRLSEVRAGVADLDALQLHTVPRATPRPGTSVDRLITSRADCIFLEGDRRLGLLERVAAGRGHHRFVALAPRPVEDAQVNNTGWIVTHDSISAANPCAPDDGQPLARSAAMRPMSGVNLNPWPLHADTTTRGPWRSTKNSWSSVEVYRHVLAVTA
jgi:hypothetical protein